jgi:hypothetical protein
VLVNFAEGEITYFLNQVSQGVAFKSKIFTSTAKKKAKIKVLIPVFGLFKDNSTALDEDPQLEILKPVEIFSRKSTAMNSALKEKNRSLTEKVQRMKQSGAGLDLVKRVTEKVRAQLSKSQMCTSNPGSPLFSPKREKLGDEQCGCDLHQKL